jgi:Zn-dependent M28 family amino/carboxypeptidase
VRGWITDSAATSLLAQAGLSMTDLRRRAESRDFRPVPTGIIIDASMKNSVQHLSANNVVGVVRGIDPAARDEYVAYSAHWDHFGIGPVVNGDSIYNGAADNASGVASILTIAHAAAEGVKPRRSQLFVFVTAEESGLLGSAYFGEHPTVPASKIVAALNMDIVPLNGRVRDLNVMGDNKSSLGPALAQLVKSEGIRLSPDAHPEQGHFYRSDHFSFAKAGIPSVSIGGGDDIVGRPAGWGWRVGRLHGAPLSSAVRRVSVQLRSEWRDPARRHRAGLASPRERTHDPHLESRLRIPAPCAKHPERVSERRTTRFARELRNWPAAGSAARLP